MRSRAWFMVVGSVLCAAATQASCGSDSPTGGGGAGGTGAGGAGGATSTTVSSTTGVNAGGTGGTAGSPGTGGTAGTGGTGGTAVTPDKCPGDAHSVGETATLTLTGSTVGLSDDIQVNTARCQGGADTSGPDAVYAITFTGNSTVTAKVTGTNGLDAILIVQDTCGDMTTTEICENETTSGSESATFAVSPNTTVYFIVDGQAGSAGDFTLQIDAKKGKCGDGYINVGETCDDGDTVPGDGCSATCQTELPPDTSDTCDGEGVPLTSAAPVDIEGMMFLPAGEATTSPYHDNYTTCDGVPETGGVEEGKDRVFHFVPATAGTMHVELRNLGTAGMGFDGTLSGWRDTCTPGPALAFDGTHDAPTGSYLGCSDQAFGTDPYFVSDTNTFEVLPDFAVTAGEAIYIVVDGFQSGSEGEFWLHAELTP